MHRGFIGHVFFLKLIQQCDVQKMFVEYEEVQDSGREVWEGIVGGSAKQVWTEAPIEKYMSANLTTLSCCLKHFKLFLKNNNVCQFK